MADEGNLTPEELAEIARLEEHEIGAMSDRHVDLIRKEVGPAEPLSDEEVDELLRKAKGQE